MFNTNPYPIKSISHQIYTNNYIDSAVRINEAPDIDKMIIYLYVKRYAIKKIARMTNLSVSTTTRKLDLYEVKWK